MSVEIITKEDLRTFRNDLLEDIKALLDRDQPTAKEWLKAGQVKQLLNISSGTLQTLRINGDLKFSKVGGTYYYRYAQIQLMLANAGKLQ